MCHHRQSIYHSSHNGIHVLRLQGHIDVRERTLSQLVIDEHVHRVALPIAQLDQFLLVLQEAGIATGSGAEFGQFDLPVVLVPLLVDGVADGVVVGGRDDEAQRQLVVELHVRVQVRVLQGRLHAGQDVGEVLQLTGVALQGALEVQSPLD